MKIADVCEFYSPTGGGVRAYVQQKLEWGARLGHDLTIIAPGGETRTESVMGGRIAWIESPHLPVDRNYRMFWETAPVWRALDQAAPDIVEGSSPWRGGWIAGRWPGNAARVLFMHSDPVASYPQTALGGVLGRDRVDWLFGWFWSYLRRLNALFDMTVVTGDWLAQRFSGFRLSHMHAIPLGVERTLFSPGRRSAAQRRVLLAQCGLGEEAALLVTVGRHHPEKRLGMLIEAVNRAQRQRRIGLQIIGDGLSRRLVDAWAAQSRHVHVAGQLHDREKLAEAIASADALVHGCASETFGLAVAEALCAGTPVVVPDAGGASELATPDCAEIYRAGDPAAATAAILRLLARDRAALSATCLATAETRIATVEQHFRSLFALYEDVARNRTQPR